MQRPAGLTETSPHQTASSAEENLALTGLVWVYPRPGFTVIGDRDVSLGRDPQSTVVLEGSQVSRIHAVVSAQLGGYVVRDQQSRNGTFLGGTRVNEAQLTPGCVLRVGEWVAVFGEWSGAAVRREPLFSEPAPGFVLGPRSREAWEALERLAASDQPILIEGPTGTGKEVFARLVHERSGRKGPLVGINCAAIPEALVEAQLFGHAKGAFTGATQSAVGLIAAADGGTVLLDEIAELPLGQQAKLLRAIEERSVLRVGETTPRPVNVRYVAACQRSLWKLSQEGTFRADLVGRLAGGRLKLLPLEQRREEVPMLFMHHFVTAGGAAAGVSATAIEALCLSAWPLNIRQVVQCARLSALSYQSDGVIAGATMRTLLAQVHADDEELPSEPEPGPASNDGARPAGRRSRWLSRHQGELDLLLGKMKECGGNVSEACRQLGLPRWRAVRLLSAMEDQDR